MRGDGTWSAAELCRRHTRFLAPGVHGWRAILRVLVRLQSKTDVAIGKAGFYEGKVTLGTYLERAEIFGGGFGSNFAHTWGRVWIIMCQKARMHGSRNCEEIEFIVLELLGPRYIHVT